MPDTAIRMLVTYTFNLEGGFLCLLYCHLETKKTDSNLMLCISPILIYQYYVMNYSINSFTGASKAPAYGGYVLLICKKNEFSCAFFPLFGFQNGYFSKIETSILFYFLRAFQCFLQISKIQTLSRVMSKKQQNSTFSKSFIIQKQYEESFWKFNTSIL